MLLLVLILVLVAFGLLVVALLTGNVLSAWLSVAVSVAAAVVLVIDWLQRRSAVKAGRAGAEGTAPPATESSREDLDPVTEVLPVYAPDGESDPAGETVVSEERSERAPEGQQTVVMPAFQPSGSAARPSGAEGTSTPSGGSSSRRVTSEAAEQPAGDDGGPRSDDRTERADRTEDRSDAEATVVVDIRKAGIGGSAPAADATSSVFDTDRPGSGSGESATQRPDPAPAAEATQATGDAGSGSVAAGAAGAAGIAGAAVAGGLAAAKHEPGDRTAADTQAVDVEKAGGRAPTGPTADQPDASRPDERRLPTGATAPSSRDSAEGTSDDVGRAATRRPEERPAGAGSPTAEDHTAADRDTDSATPRTAGAWASAAAAPGAAASEGRTGSAPEPGSDSPAAGGRPGETWGSGSAPDERGAPTTPGSDQGRLAGARPGSDMSAAEIRPGDAGSNAPAEGRPDGGRAPGSDMSAGRPGGTREAGEGRLGGEPSGGEDRPAAWAAGSDAPAGEGRGGEPWASGAPAGETRPGGAWATGAAAAAGAAGRAGGAAEHPGEHGPSDRGEPAPTGDSSRAAGGVDTSGPATDADTRSAEARGEQATLSEPPAGDEEAARTGFGGSVPASGHDLFEPAAGSADATAVMGAQQGGGQQAYSSDAEAPEESVDPVVARVAATVEDEVLVIDEQPRYHLLGCRALAAQQTIPLPAREAVELGFTPCGWCNPAAVLGARHPASARP